MIPESELKQMREVCEKATLPPWTHHFRERVIVDAIQPWMNPSSDDVEFIVMARNNFERLLDEVERLREVNAGLYGDLIGQEHLLGTRLELAESAREKWKAKAEKLVLGLSQIYEMWKECEHAPCCHSIRSFDISDELMADYRASLEKK